MYILHNYCWMKEITRSDTVPISFHFCVRWQFWRQSRIAGKVLLKEKKKSWLFNWNFSLSQKKKTKNYYSRSFFLFTPPQYIQPSVISLQLAINTFLPQNIYDWGLYYICFIHITALVYFTNLFSFYL